MTQKSTEVGFSPLVRDGEAGDEEVNGACRDSMMAWKKVHAFGFTCPAARQIVSSMDEDREATAVETGYRAGGPEMWTRIGELLGQLHTDQPGRSRLPVYYRAIEAGRNPYLAWMEKAGQLREEVEQLLGEGVVWDAVREAGGETRPRSYTREEVVALLAVAKEDAHVWSVEEAEGGVLVLVHEVGDVLTLTPRPRFHMRSVNGGVPERIRSSVALAEINAAQMENKVHVAEMSTSATGGTASILYKSQQRGLVELRPATAEESAAREVPPSGRYKKGDRVIGRRVTWIADEGGQVVRPVPLEDAPGTFLCLTEQGKYQVRHDKNGTTADYLVREVRPATAQELKGLEE